MDATTSEMVFTAYDDTFRDAKQQGRTDLVAHREGLTAAAMCLAALTGIEDEAARTQVNRIDFRALAEAA